MSEIKCPKCGEVFQIAESDYTAIVQQIRDKEFEKELDRREKQLFSDNQHLLELSLAKRDAESAEKLSEKEAELASMRSELEKKNTEQELAISKALAAKNEELSKREEEILALKGQIENEALSAKLREKAAEDGFRAQLAAKDEQIAFYKDFKAKQSTKMIGESLEVHCLNEFNRVRAMGFQNAYFEKDNAVSKASGSKGDFIFRDYTDGVEYISIMFEMKNEGDETATKHKNEDFFKELDKDRREKNCEYAVLVTMLEPDNDLYNEGIVDVSHRYPKMYVIRPQFFLPLLSILRNAAMNSASYIRQLAEIRNQNIDISNFEDQLADFKDKFSRNCRIAGEKFSTAIEEIDKTISHLQKTREALVGTITQLQHANNKAEDLTIKRLTKGNATMEELFREARGEGVKPDSAADGVVLKEKQVKKSRKKDRGA